MAIKELEKTFTMNEDRLESLKQIIPEAFADGKINWNTLKECLGEYLEDDSTENFGLFWTGKRDARRLAAQPSKGTLVPCLGEGINENTTENIFIEGDNLEVLKILRKSYKGKIKMIYIDPPYNTGNDFIYKDDYFEPLDSYLRKTKQKDEEGRLLTTNSKADGRFHSNWLNMMYPRLSLARRLLRDDGFIVISIDDDEMSNLITLLNQIFGEENHIGVLIWDKNRKNDAKYFSIGHEYMVIYAKDEQLLRDLEIKLRLPKEGIDEVKTEFQRLRVEFNDNWEQIRQNLRAFFAKLDEDDPRKPLARYSKVDERGPYRDDGNINWPGGGGPTYDVIHPITEKPCKKPRSGWRYPTKERFDEEVKKGRIVFGKDETIIPSVRTNLFESDTQVMGSVHYSYAQTAANEFDAIFNGVRVFDNPKPLNDLVNLIRYFTNEDDLVLDFFAGAATTAHAVMEVNRKDLSHRRYICIQLPEVITDKTSTGRNALSLGFNTISEISKKRILLAREGILKAFSNQPLFEDNQIDFGVKIFKLSGSNFRKWTEYEGKNIKELGDLFRQFESPLVEDWKIENVLSEIILIEGFPLSSNQVIDEKFERNKVYCISHAFNEHQLFICLDNEIYEDTVEVVADLPKQDIFICLDSALTDEAKIKLADVCQIKTF